MSADLVHVSRHPLVANALAQLRDHATPSPVFRDLVNRLARMLCYEATADVDLSPTSVNTPLAQCEVHRLAERVGLIPILRAGLGMAEAMLELMPEACVWHLGLFRDHETLLPVTYYNKLPAEPNIDVALVLDPMLATGGSAIAAIDVLKRWGQVRIKFVGLIAAPEGVRSLQEKHPDVPIHLGALDSHLNEKGYIVPGLGDAGDRQFGT